MHKTKCNVLIVGFGPTGSVLANLLSKYNITIHILEKENEIYNLPRAVHFDDEIMRTFKSIGIFKKFLKKTIINKGCLLYTSPSPRDRVRSRMPSSA